MASRPGPISSFWAAGADVDDAAVVGLLRAGPDLLVAELHAALLDDQERGAADGADEHGAEQERHRAADQHADEHLRLGDRQLGPPRAKYADESSARSSPRCPTQTAMKLANSDTAAMTAEPMAMPLVIGLRGVAHGVEVGEDLAGALFL
jgi:hypothetical protein